MSKALSLAFALAAVLAGGAPAADATARTSFLIQASSTFQRLGDYWISDNPTYKGALDSLGPSSSCHLAGSPTTVVASWRPLGVTMSLRTYGGLPQGKTGCTAPSLIHVSTIRVTGARWYTSFGLHVGDSVGKLESLYRRAKVVRALPGWHRAGYVLVTQRTACIGFCTTTFVTVPVLVAETSGGRVSAFVFVVGAEGE